jgi:hypothetical protein
VHYTECRYAECNYAEWRGAVCYLLSKPFCSTLDQKLNFSVNHKFTKCFITMKPEPCTIKTLRIRNLRIPYKLVCLWLKIEKTLAYYEICPFAVNYESVMFYSSGTKRQHHNEIFYISSPKRFIEYSPGQYKTFYACNVRVWIKKVFVRGRPFQCMQVRPEPSRVKHLLGAHV